jgi:hypothetical protein
MGLFSTVQAGLAWGPRVTPREVCAAVVRGILVGSRVVLCAVLRGHSHLIGMLVDILRAARKLWDFMLDTFNFCHFCMQPVTSLRIALLANPRALLARPIATPMANACASLRVGALSERPEPTDYLKAISTPT